MNLKCEWCGAPGEHIGDAKSFPSIKAAKCTKCHHEWEFVASRDGARKGYYNFVRDTNGDSYDGTVVSCEFCTQEFLVGDLIQETCPSCKAILNPSF
jgi:hypothetical protein